MEQAIVKLIEIVAANMSALYRYNADPKQVVDKILEDGSVALLPEFKKQLYDYFSMLN